MKILLPLSRDESRAAALRLCVETAAGIGADVRALFVVDRDGIRRCEAGAPPGAIRLALEAGQKIAEREAALGKTAIAEAADVFGRAGLPFAGDLRDGSPPEEIRRACAGCDLLVAGLASRFGYMEEDPGHVALSIMKDRIVPVLLAADPYRAVRTVVVGCGGGSRTVSAVGAMARLALWKSGCRVLLLAIDDSAREGRARLDEPRRILSEAGYPPTEGIVLPGPKLAAFREFLEHEHADAVVLGGWGEHRWNDLLGGSVTGMLLESGSRHLFLFM